jgi:hypothetical protein
MCGVGQRPGIVPLGTGNNPGLPGLLGIGLVKIGLRRDLTGGNRPGTPIVADPVAFTNVPICQLPLIRSLLAG